MAGEVRRKRYHAQIPSYGVADQRSGLVCGATAAKASYYFVRTQLGNPRQTVVKNVSSQDIDAPMPAHADTRCVTDVRDEKGNLAPETALARQSGLARRSMSGVRGMPWANITTFRPGKR
jgi:hypothetical protein